MYKTFKNTFVFRILTVNLHKLVLICKFIDSIRRAKKVCAKNCGGNWNFLLLPQTIYFT